MVDKQVLTKFLDHTSHWTLKHDSQLRACLQETTDTLFNTINELETLGDELGTDVELLSIRQDNIYNKIACLKDARFIEERVEEVKIDLPNRNPVSETNQKDSSNHEERTTRAITNALKQGLHLIDERFKHVGSAPGLQDSSIFKPVYPYVNRPLPELIGSAKFLSSIAVNQSPLPINSPLQIQPKDESLHEQPDMLKQEVPGKKREISDDFSVRRNEIIPRSNSPSRSSIRTEDNESVSRFIPQDPIVNNTANAYANNTNQSWLEQLTAKSAEVNRRLAEEVQSNASMSKTSRVSEASTSRKFQNSNDETASRKSVEFKTPVEVHQTERRVEKPAVPIKSVLKTELVVEPLFDSIFDDPKPTSSLVSKKPSVQPKVSPSTNLDQPTTSRKSLAELIAISNKQGPTPTTSKQPAAKKSQYKSLFSSSSSEDEGDSKLFNSSKSSLLEARKNSFPAKMAAQPSTSKNIHHSNPKTITSSIEVDGVPKQQKLPLLTPVDITEVEVCQGEDTFKTTNLPEVENSAVPDEEEVDDEMAKPVLKAFDMDFSDRLAAAIKNGPAMRSNLAPPGRRPVSMAASIPVSNGDDDDHQRSRASVPKTFMNSSVSSNEELGPTSIASRIAQIGNKIPVRGSGAKSLFTNEEDEAEGAKTATTRPVKNDAIKERAKGPVRRAPSNLRNSTANDPSAQQVQMNQEQSPEDVTQTIVPNPPPKESPSTAQKLSPVNLPLPSQNPPAQVVKPSSTKSPTAPPPVPKKTRSIFESSSSDDDLLLKKPAGTGKSSNLSDTLPKQTQKSQEGQADKLFTYKKEAPSTTAKPKTTKGLFDDSDSDF